MLAATITHHEPLRLAKREPHMIVPLNPKRASLLRLRARLRRALHAFLQQQAPKIAGQVIVLRSQVQKAALSPDELDQLEAIVSGVDFAGWAALVGDVQPMLEEIVADGSVAAFLQIHLDTELRPEVLNVVNAESVAYSEARSAEMVGMRRDALGRLVENPDARWRIDEGTRDYLRAAVGDAIQEGWSNDRLAEAIVDSYGFSEERAQTIARTETNLASNQGALASYKASGVVDGKQWVTAEDDRVSEECEANGDAGPNGDGVLFDLDGTYPSGDAAPPVHPNCRCAIVPFIDFTNQPTEQAGA